MYKSTITKSLKVKKNKNQTIKALGIQNDKRSIHIDEKVEQKHESCVIWSDPKYRHLFWAGFCVLLKQC